MHIACTWGWKESSGGSLQIRASWRLQALVQTGRPRPAAPAPRMSQGFWDALLADNREDLWFAWDKAGHVAACALGTWGMLWLFKCLGSTVHLHYRLLWAFLVSFLGGLVKELGDYAGWWRGDPSAKDLIADAAGCAIAVSVTLLCVSYGWLDAGSASGGATPVKRKLVDLELGLVYGHQLKRAIIKGAPDWPWLQRLAATKVGPITLQLHQDPTASASLPAPTRGGLSDWLIDEEHTPGVQWPVAEATGGASRAAGGTGSGSRVGPAGQAHLANVGLVVWQSGLVLAELLLRRPPFGPWGKHVHVLDLGTGTGLVGLALALAGARATLTDLPHVLPLTRTNLAANFPAAVGDVVVAEYCWGDDPTTLIHQVGGAPDVITAADVLYDASQHAPLLASLSMLAAPHTAAFIAYRKRSVKEEGFAAAAEAAGFAVEIAPDTLLAEEYQGGAYCVMRLARREAAPAVGDVALAVGAQGAGQGGEDDGDEELEHKPCVQC